MAGVAGLVGFFVLYFGFVYWKHQAIKARSFVSSADPEAIRDAFVRKVATTGWKIVDDGNPMIAQSPLLAGIRQQVGLTLLPDGDRVRGEYETLRYVRKALTGTPTKAITLASRKSAFFKELDRINQRSGNHGRIDVPSQATPPDTVSAGIPVDMEPLKDSGQVSGAIALSPQGHDIPAPDATMFMPTVGASTPISGQYSEPFDDDSDDGATVRRSDLVGGLPPTAPQLSPAPASQGSPPPNGLSDNNPSVSSPWYVGAQPSPVEPNGPLDRVPPPAPPDDVAGDVPQAWWTE